MTTPFAAPILALHGYGMSARSILAKSGAIRTEVKKLPFSWFAFDGPCDCITQAPLPPPPPALPAAAAAAAASTATNDSENETIGKNTPAVTLPPTLTLEPGARAWYSFANMPVTGRYDLFEEGMSFIAATLAERAKQHEQNPQQNTAPVKGLFLFSQGTIVGATWLRRLAAAPETLPPFMREVKFAIVVSGLLPKDFELRKELLLGEKIALPTLHIIGKADKLVEPALSLELASSMFENPVIYEHDGGHVIPSNARKAVKAFLQDQM